MFGSLLEWTTREGIDHPIPRLRGYYYWAIRILSKLSIPHYIPYISDRWWQTPESLSFLGVICLTPWVGYLGCVFVTVTIMYMYSVSSISLNIIGIKIIFFVGHAYLAYWKFQLNISQKAFYKMFHRVCK